jgi:hypothetical protein
MVKGPRPGPILPYPKPPKQAIHATRRFGAVFSGYLESPNRMDEDLSVSLKSMRGPPTITTIQLLLVMTFLMSLNGIGYVLLCNG